MGMLVVPELSESQNNEISGNRYPEKTPANMARNIHNVRYLSKKDNLFIRNATTVI